MKTEPGIGARSFGVGSEAEAGGASAVGERAFGARAARREAAKSARTGATPQDGANARS